jgi:hypothetical protein
LGAFFECKRYQVSAVHPLSNTQCEPESKPHYNRTYTRNVSLKIAAARADLVADELGCVSLSDPDCATVLRKAVFISHYVTTPRHEHAGPCLNNLLAIILPHAKNKERRRRRKKKKIKK